jgi:probable rRNA maturation factor
MLQESKVNFFFPKKTTLADRSTLKSFIEKIFKKEGKRLSRLNYIFCSDNELLRINREYLGHDYYTDIITFDLSVKAMPVQAEIYISVERVKENAAKLGFSFKAELHRVIFHGVLHLCGYGDKTSHQMKIMRQKEESYLNQYFN